MWKFILVFGVGVVTGALGASYLAGVDEGRRLALEEEDSNDACSEPATASS